VTTPIVIETTTRAAADADDFLPGDGPAAARGPDPPQNARRGERSLAPLRGEGAGGSGRPSRSVASPCGSTR